MSTRAQNIVIVLVILAICLFAGWAIFLSPAPAQGAYYPDEVVVFIPADANGDLDWSVLESAPVPPHLDITPVAGATKHYVELLKQFPSIQFSTTFAHKSNYRFDWAKQSVGRVYGAYVWTDLRNDTVRIRLLIMDPPPLLNECRGFQFDANFRNRDQSIADWDQCYLNFYFIWRGRPEVDMYWQMQQDRLHELIWRDALRKVNLKSADVQQALKALGLEADGMPPYSSRYYNLFDQTELDYQTGANRIMNEQLGISLEDTVPDTVSVYDVTGLTEDQLPTSEDTFDQTRVQEVKLSDLEQIDPEQSDFWNVYDMWGIPIAALIGLLVLAGVAAFAKVRVFA